MYRRKGGCKEDEMEGNKRGEFKQVRCAFTKYNLNVLSKWASGSSDRKYLNSVKHWIVI